MRWAGLAVCAVSLACLPQPAALPSPSTTKEPTVLQFHTSHHFLAFVVDGQRLVFSGGPAERTTSSPEIYTRDLRTGREELLARSADDRASILALASEGGILAFAETFPDGPTIYRVRAIAAGRDVVLDELTVQDPDAAQRTRFLIGPPMVAVGAGIVVWSAGSASGAHHIVAVDIASGRRIDLRTVDDWLGYPRMSGRDVVFSQGRRDRSVWIVDPFSGSAPRRVIDENDVSQAAIWGDNIVMKKGGADTFDPAGIQLCGTTSRQCQLITPSAALAWEPSIGERFIVWQGETSQLTAFDLMTNKLTTLAEASRDTRGRRGIVGRAAVFVDTVVWLSSPPGDLPQAAVFNVFRP